MCTEVRRVRILARRFVSSMALCLLLTVQSDYSRSQYTEKYIQERVASELKKLETETIAKFQDSLKQNVNRDDDNSTLDVKQTNAKIDKLTKVLEANSQFYKVEIDPKLEELRKSVIQCLKDNGHKTLNCWDEVEAFKALVRQA